MSTVFLVGLISGAGLMAAVIFGAEAWYARRHPITKLGQLAGVTGLSERRGS